MMERSVAKIIIVGIELIILVSIDLISMVNSNNLNNLKILIILPKKTNSGWTK
tara:strand:+ start:594 stop:752 length:159 start_codon:yes stop_codon:yes gene_type:complete